MSLQFAKKSAKAIPVFFTDTKTWPGLSAGQPASVQQTANLEDFSGKDGTMMRAHTPGKPGFVVVLGLEAAGSSGSDPLLPGMLAMNLPAGDYYFANKPQGGVVQLELATIAWMLASYQFTRYAKPKSEAPRLVAPDGVDKAKILRLAESVHLSRDLINTPANDMGVPALTKHATDIARKYKARVKIIKGDALLRQNFPLIHAVGRAGADAPLLADIQWGRARAPKVTLVGKGVCFDTGGLDIKAASGMLNMKKDMGGAAVAIGLARAIMDAKLDVRLRLLLPIVENSIAGNAFHPGDVYKSRKGITVEIGNTDAEGRLILADALALADDESPELMLDFATLTGAARIATGPELPPFYCTDDAMAADLMERGLALGDNVWRLPLWKPYQQMLASKIADTNNVSPLPFAGSITAALFLNRFVSKAKTWAHFDVYAWTLPGNPARPEGAEGQTIRLLYDYLAERYGSR